MQRLFTSPNQALSSESKEKKITMHNDESKEKHKVRYVSYKEIYPGQIRYSSHNKAEKIKKLKEKKAAVLNETTNEWEYKHHHGTSLFSKKDALPVVHTKFGYVLKDGHHDLLSSIELKAEIIPIKVENDLRHLSKEEFWKMAEKEGMVYLYDIKGEKSLPPESFAELIDDSNRYFAAITARKYFMNEDGSFSSKGAEHPLWVKINKDIPFIEFKIANALFAKGFVYKVDQMGNPPKQEFIDQARKILMEANIPGLRVVPNSVHFEKIKIDGASFVIENEDAKEDSLRVGCRG